MAFFQAAAQTPEENKTIVQRMFDEVWNKGNLDVVDEIFSADYVLHDPAGGEVRGPEEFKQFMTAMGNPFPDTHVTVEDMVAEGDKVATRRTYTGTHQGEYMGIPPTGSRVTVTVIDIHRLLGGKVVESWLSYDMLGLLQQLGVIPPTRETYTWGEPSTVTDEPGDPETNKAIFQRMIDEVFAKGNLAVIDELFAADYVKHDPPSGMEFRGPEGFKQWLGTMSEPYFSESHFTGEDMIAEGDKVAVRWTWSATHAGEVMGIPRTGRQIAVTGTCIHRFADGKFVESWTSYDALGMMQQLGVIPPLEPTAVESRTWGQVKSLFK